MQANIESTERFLSIEEAVIAYQAGLYRLAYSYVRNSADAMDIVQETAYKAIKNKRSLDDITRAKPWLYRIAVNTALDYLRKNRHVITLDEMPEGQSEDTHARMELDDLLTTLDDETRTVIILKYFEDMKLKDISRVTGQNLNTVKSRLHRGLKKLRLEYTSDEEENYAQ